MTNVLVTSTEGKSSNNEESPWKTILLIGSVHFTATVCVALQSPFYPKEAEKKGASATEHGFVFGIFELVSFVSCPLFGKYLNVLGAKLVLTGGALLNGLSCIGFGLLDMVDSHQLFVILSLVMRALEAVGASAIFAAAFAIAATKCPDRVGTTFATIEVFYGLGYIVGPTVGGLLYQVGGFILPFVVTGSLLVCASLMTAVFLEESPKGGQQPSLLRLMVSPGVILNAFVTFSTAITLGFYSATLEPHIRQFGLSPSQIGGLFVISGVLYAMLTIPVGKIVDYYIDAKFVVIFGAILSLIGICLVGPAPFIDINPSIFYCIAGLIFHGVGVSCLMPPTFADSITSAVKDGFPDDMTTNALVSGFWAASFALGAFVGPSVAGYLLDTVGFRIATYFVIVANITVIVVEILFMMCCSERSQSSPKYSKVIERPSACCVNVTACITHTHQQLLVTAATKLPDQYDTRPVSVSITAEVSDE